MPEVSFCMPKLGESITEATIITWLKKEGDFIEEDEILLEVATDKVDTEIPSTVSGIVKKITYKKDQTVKIGSAIAVIETVKTTVNKKKNQPAQAIKKEEKTPATLQKKQKRITASSEKFVSANTNTFFSPLIISIAKKQHISFEELARIPGTGKKGRLRKSDVFKYLEQGRPYKFSQPVVKDPTAYRIPQLVLDKGKGKIIEMDRMRQMIANHMVYSKHTSPHVTTYIEADLTNIVAWRNTHKEAFLKKYKEKLTFTPLFVEAVAKAIQDFPNINASVDGKNIILKETINIGMATALPSGNLIVPVIKDANKKSIPTLASSVNALAKKARENNLDATDIKGSTFTISNVGTFGSLMGTPIINQPEVAILAFGIIKKRPEVISSEKGDKIAIRSMMYLSLSFDHRVVDGFLGGSFLKRVAENLEQFDIQRSI